MSELSALQSALAVEREVVYGYGVLGARLSLRARAYAITSLNVHRARRDSLARLVGSAGNGRTRGKRHPHLSAGLRAG